MKYLTQGFDISALDTDSHSFCKDVPALQEGKDELQLTHTIANRHVPRQPITTGSSFFDLEQQ